MYAGTTAALGEPQQARMGGIPSAIQIFEVTVYQRDLVSSH
jgi:hypothetical protein